MLYIILDTVQAFHFPVVPLSTFDGAICETRSDEPNSIWCTKIPSYLKTNDQNNHYIPKCSDQKCI